uniref:Sodium/myo-inositol cotransporter n=1 Tax=Clytia hemisphaerica TaxID=252671 RepID=A0A7M5V3D8_9CNID
MVQAENNLTAADISVICVYIVAVIAVGIWSMFQSKRGTVSGYFLAGRFMTFIPVGMSLFASNIGSSSLIGLSGSGAAAGIAVSGYEINAIIFIQLLGFVFLPVYIASGVCTLPEYIHKRFGGNRIRIFLSCLSLLLYIFTKVSVSLYSGALFIQQSVGWNLYVSILGLLLLTGLCTITGGLATVIYLDTLMALVMVGGATVMSAIGFDRVGGFDGLRKKYMNAVPDEVLLGNTTCGIPRPDSFQLMREPLHSDLPWPGFLLGQTTVSIWYWCSDQVIVQRSLAAKSLSHAQGGTLLASALKLFPLYIMVMPGMISRVLFPNEVMCVDPDKCFEICESRTGCTNIALPLMVLRVMPSGLRGMMLAVMMAALMSDLTSIFNSAATLFTMDIYQSVRKKADTGELMVVGRLFIVVLCVFAVLWVPLLKELQGGQLFLYIQSVSSYLSPPIAAVYCLALLWKRSNEKGTFWGMMVGFFAGITRMILDFSYPAPACNEVDTRPTIIKNVHFFYVALILFVLTIIVCIVVSLLTEPPSEEMIIRTTVWTKHDQTIRSDELEEEKQHNENDQLERTKRTSSKISPQNYESVELRSKEDQASDNQDQQESGTEVEQPEPVTCWKRVFYFICGLSNESAPEQQQSADEQRNHFQEVISLQQNPRVKKLLTGASIFSILVSVSLLILYTVPDGGPTRPTIDIPYLPFVNNGTRPYKIDL